MLSDELKALAFKHTLQYVNAICDLKEVPRVHSEMRMIEDAIRAAVAEAVAAEREVFVKLIEADDDDWLFDFETQTAIPLDRVRVVHFALKKIVAAVRARGEEQ